MSNIVERQIRVWNRRMGIDDSHTAGMAKACEKAFPGSVLRGPLAVVFSVSLRLRVGDIADADRRAAAMAMSEVLTNILRHDAEVNLLQQLAIHCDSSVLMRYSIPMLELLNDAIASRQREYDTPNLANVILGRHRR